MLALPRVGFRGGLEARGESGLIKDETAKISVEVFWNDRLECYLMVSSRLHAESDIEFELVKQIRARRLAEDNYNKARAQIVEKQSVLDAIIEYAPVPRRGVRRQAEVHLCDAQLGAEVRPGVAAPVRAQSHSFALGGFVSGGDRAARGLSVRGVRLFRTSRIWSWSSARSAASSGCISLAAR